MIDIIVNNQGIVFAVLVGSGVFIWFGSLAYAKFRATKRWDEIHALALAEARGGTPDTDDVTRPLDVIAEFVAANCDECRAKCDIALDERKLAGIKLLQAQRYAHASAKLPAGSARGKEAYLMAREARTEGTRALARSKRLFAEATEFMDSPDAKFDLNIKTAGQVIDRNLRKRHGISQA